MALMSGTVFATTVVPGCDVVNGVIDQILGTVGLV
jgi:hypothetical protein